MHLFVRRERHRFSSHGSFGCLGWDLFLDSWWRFASLVLLGVAPGP